MIAQAKNAPVFLYLYPQKDILDFEIRHYSWIQEYPELQMEFESRLSETSDEYEQERLREEYCQEAAKSFKKVYSHKLNQAINLRYRKKGFKVFYALLDDGEVSDVVKVQPSDEIIYVGMNTKTHRTPDKNGKYPYPDRDFILNQLGNVSRLVVSGFHLHDCVKKVSRRAYARGINVLVDEELTELFGIHFQRSDFDVRKYPGINPRNIITNPEMFEYFLQRRRNKPWLYPWQ